MSPELGFCPLHLKLPQRAFVFGFQGFGNQEVQFSVFLIRLDSLTPFLPN